MDTGEKEQKGKAVNLLYLSEGNIPSRAANSVHVVKMSQALSRQCRKFELVTFGDIFHFLKLKKTGIRYHYDVAAFKVTVLPLYLSYHYPHRRHYRDSRYRKIAPLYCATKKNHIILTRSPQLAIACLQRGARVVLEYHQVLSDTYLDHDSLRWENFLGLITISDRITETYRTRGLDQRKLLVLPDGVDLGAFENQQGKSQSRLELSLPPDGTTVMYCGHLYDFKGIPLILDLAERLPEIRFILVGGYDEDKAEWEGKARDRALKNVIFTGFVDQRHIPRYLSAADILLLPNSARHTWSSTTSPLKLFEYMAAGRPLVASRLENIASVIRDGETGMLAEPDNPESFCSAIRGLLQEPGRAARLGDNARTVVTDYSWDKRAKKMIEFIDQQNRCM